jgi:two-component system nitrate/nitrite response regulator NarL
MTQVRPEDSGSTLVSVAILVRNEVLRHGLETILRGLPQVGAVHQWRSGPDGAAARRCSILIVTNSEAADVREVAGRMKILMLLDEASTRQPVLAGFGPLDGFLIQRDVSVQTLGGALDRIAAGELPLPAQLARELLAQAGSARGADRPRPLPLTARENETLALLADGLSNKQIARRLTVSDHGAKRLVTSVLLKLGAPNRTTAVVTAIKTGLIDYPADRSAVASTSPNSGLAR